MVNYTSYLPLVSVQCSLAATLTFQSTLNSHFNSPAHRLSINSINTWLIHVVCTFLWGTGFYFLKFLRDYLFVYLQ